MWHMSLVTHTLITYNSLQCKVCGPKASMTFLEWMKILPSGAENILHSVQQESFSEQNFECPAEWDDLEHQLCYNFKNKSLLSEALTHASSSASARSYERFEFLGDAVLGKLPKIQRVSLKGFSYQMLSIYIHSKIFF